MSEIKDIVDASQLKELPAVAKSINLPCKKCGVDRFFTVVAHKTATSAKVKCEVCGASQTFKLTATKTKKPRKPSTKKPTVTPEAVWNSLKEAIGEEDVKPYNMKTRFEVETAIKHPKFGLGFIKLATSEKVDVAFQDGERSLVHNRQ